MSTPNPTPLWIAKPPLSKLPQVLGTHTGSFADTKDLSSAYQASKGCQWLFSQALIEKKEKKLAAELLRHVFDANPKAVQEFLAQIPPNLKCIILIKSCANEGYYSKKQEKMVCTRTWPEVSPLEAAALTGDNFLVLELLAYMLKRLRHQAVDVQTSLRLQAAAQLEAILNRLETAENGDYLAPFKALIKAYQEFIKEYPALYAADNWAKIDELWDFVGEMQQRLSTYGLQEFCDEKPFSPLPNFKQAPTRSCLLDGEALDLDSIGAGSFMALYKAGDGAGGVRGVRGVRRWCGGARLDLAAISRLCEARPLELRNIIKSLREPMLVAEDVSMDTETHPSHSPDTTPGQSLSSPRFSER
jgi:hypothetical protein